MKRRPLFATFAHVALLALALGIVALLAQPATASADQPNRTVEADDLTSTTAVCGFPVSIHFEGFLISLAFNPTGAGTTSYFFGGPFKATLTNLDTGESIQVSIAGPERITIAPDGTGTDVGTGPWLFTSHNPVTGEPGIWLSHGRFVGVHDAVGTLTSFTFVGTSTNLCLELAA